MTFWSDRVCWLIVFLAVGCLTLTGCGREPAPAVRGSTNPNVTKENYVKIKPEMTSWEVSDILGSGEVVGEQGTIVDAAGHFRKYSWGSGFKNEQTGTVSPHDGKPSQEIRQEVVWRNGEQAIYVTFLNNKAVSKKEDRLFH